MGNIKQLYTSMSIRVPVSFRKKYVATKDFWKELGVFFAEVVKPLTAKQLNVLKSRYPDMIQFIEELLP